VLLNRARANAVLERGGFDGIVALQPIHVLYLTDYSPRMLGARWDVAYGAVLARDEAQPTGLVVPAMELLFLDEATLRIHALECYLAPLPDASPLDASEPRAVPFTGFPVSQAGNITANVRAKLEVTRRYGSRAAPDAAHALGRLVRGAGLERARLLTDDPRTPRWLEQAGLKHVTSVYDPAVLKEIRVVKTPDEIERLRAAARSNESACRGAAACARVGMTAAELERRFAIACIERGNVPTYLVADLGALPQGGVHPGEPLMLDALSHRDGYHGDFGRTLVIGDVDAELERRAAGLDAAWQAARAAIRPGNDYEAIKSAAAQGAREADFPEFQPPTPHCVGLQHTDDPVPAGLHPGIKPNRVLEPGMVLNLDMPFVEWGWGTLHREDTVLVTDAGCELLTSDDETLIRL